MQVAIDGSTTECREPHVWIAMDAMWYYRNGSLTYSLILLGISETKIVYLSFNHEKGEIENNVVT